MTRVAQPHLTAHCPDDSESDRPLPAGLAAPARRSLAALGITELRHLTMFAEAEIRFMHGMGPKALERLHRALQDTGWSFAER